MRTSRCCSRHSCSFPGAALAWIGDEGSRRVALVAIQTMFEGIARETGARLGQPPAGGGADRPWLATLPAPALASLAAGRDGAAAASRIAHGSFEHPRPHPMGADTQPSRHGCEAP
jgi:hypothetical protein